MSAQVATVRPHGRIYGTVEGAPVQPKDWVTITQVIDEAGEAVGCAEWIGHKALVVYLEYDCGCGQTYPGDPMIGVRIHCQGVKHEYWHEELRLLET